MRREDEGDSIGGEGERRARGWKKRGFVPSPAADDSYYFYGQFQQSKLLKMLVLEMHNVHLGEGKICISCTFLEGSRRMLCISLIKICISRTLDASLKIVI